MILSNKNTQLWTQILLYASLALWVYAFFTSIYCLTPNFQDLRNRITGARLMRDGLDPYLYIWKNGLPLRYYDSNLPQNLPVSVATATPAFHWLIGPLAELPQYQINVSWFFLEWASAVTSVLLAINLATSRLYKSLISLAGALFCLTAGFKQHIFQGQLYLFVPALMMITIWLIEKRKNLLAYIIGGLCLTIIFFIRPTFLILLAPLILYKKANPFVLAAFLSTVTYAVFAFINPTQKQAWISYAQSIRFYSGAPRQEHVVFELNRTPYTQIEGVQFDSAINASAFNAAYLNKDETANYHLVHKHFTGNYPKAIQLIIMQLACLAIGIVTVIWLKKTQRSFGLLQALCIAAACMWCFDVCAFAIKNLYTSMLLLYPILFLFCEKRRFKPITLWALFIGILFNLGQIPLIPMPLTVGQLLILVALIVQNIEWPLSIRQSNTGQRS